MIYLKIYRKSGTTITAWADDEIAKARAHAEEILRTDKTAYYEIERPADVVGGMTSLGALVRSMLAVIAGALILVAFLTGMGMLQGVSPAKALTFSSIEIVVIVGFLIMIALAFIIAHAGGKLLNALCAFACALFLLWVAGQTGSGAPLFYALAVIMGIGGVGILLGL